MGSMTGYKLSGLILALGAVLAVVSSALRPGVLLIDPQVGATLREQVTVLADYSNLTHITSLTGALGLLMVFSGFFTIRYALGTRSVPDTLARFGILLIMFSVFGSVVALGLNHMIAHVLTHATGGPVQLVTLAVTLQSVKIGISIMAGYPLMLGFGCLALGFLPRFTGLHRWLALLVIVVAVVGAVLLLIGNHVHDLPSGIYRVAQWTSYPMYLWAGILGVLLYKGHAAVTQRVDE